MIATNIGLSILPPAKIGHYLRDVLTPGSALHTLTALFGGLRPSESCVLNWGSSQDLEGLLIHGRDHSLRHVMPCCALKSWLAPYYGSQPKDEGSSRERRKALAELRRAVPNGSPQQLRASYAAYRLAQLGDIMQTAMELGITADLITPRFLRSPRPEDAEHVLNLTPAACGRPGWPEEVKAWRERQET